MIAVAVGAILLGAYAFSGLARVPSASGDYGEASGRVIDAGLHVVAVDATGRMVTDPHDLAVVVSQDPPPGAIRSMGSTVTLRIRPRSSTVRVPEVVGLRVSDAANVVHDAGLDLDTGGFISDNGTITATWPEAGRVVAFGSKVGYSIIRP